ncbi:MAG: hypothetical protein ACRD1N_00685 [Terriglobia bacterium]
MNSRQPCIEKEKLFAYALHLLEGGQQRKTRAHVEQCAACRKAVAEYQELHQALGEWKPAEPSPWFDARARARLRTRAASASAGWPVWALWRRWVAVAAVAAVIAVGGIRVFRGRSTRTVARVEAKAASPAPAQVVTASAKQVSAAAAPATAAGQELDLYRNLHVLENYDMLANFDVLSELPHPNAKVND